MSPRRPIAATLPLFTRLASVYNILMHTGPTYLDTLYPQRPPSLMGIVNVTPNSFSDTNQHLDPAAAIAHGRELIRAGAALLDLGAEASSFFRPGVEAVAPVTQIDRLLPVIEGLRGLPEFSARRVRLSIDTRSAEVARHCLAAGAEIINDISAGEYDPAMLRTCAQVGAPLILMHISPGYPATPSQDDPDIVGTVRNYLTQRLEAARSAGIAEERLLIDPGIGFGKTMADNWRLVDGIGALVELGFPVVLGISRKRFLIARGGGAENLAAEQRDDLTAQVTVQAARQGVPIHRVHNVACCAQALGAESGPG